MFRLTQMILILEHLPEKDEVEIGEKVNTMIFD